MAASVSAPIFFFFFFFSHLRYMSTSLWFSIIFQQETTFVTKALFVNWTTCRATLLTLVTYVSNEQLCQIILKSMHKCRSYGPDRLNLDHLIIWPSSVTSTFNLLEQMFQMAYLLLKKNNCAKLFWNSCINVQVMARTKPDRCTHAQVTMHIHRTEVVATVSRSPKQARK